MTTISSAINKDIQARWVGEETIDGEKFPGQWVIEQKDGTKRKILARYNSTDYQRLADQLGFEFNKTGNKKDLNSKTTNEASSGVNIFNAITGAIDQPYSSGGGVLKND